MTAQPAYPSDVDHRPRFLDHGLPPGGVLTVDYLRASRLLDLTAKRALYESEGVEHYWIVDPVGPSVEALALVNGVYVVQDKADARQLFEVNEPVPLSFDPIALLDE